MGLPGIDGHHGLLPGRSRVLPSHESDSVRLFKSDYGIWLVMRRNQVIAGRPRFVDAVEIARLHSRVIAPPPLGADRPGSRGRDPPDRFHPPGEDPAPPR